MTIRRASVEDASALADFAAQAFWDTYRHLDEPTDIAEYVAKHFHRDAVAGVICDPNTSLLLTEVSSQLAGYAQLSCSEAPPCVTGPDPLELVRLYLGASYIGHGHGAALMHAVHAEATRLGGRTLWLGVYDRNLRAVRFYERFGFVKVGGKEFEFGRRLYIDPIYAAPVRSEVCTER